MHIIEADLTWTAGPDGRPRFEAGVQVGIDDDGTIVAVGRDLGAAERRMPDRALLPGLVNAHSHAFQRALRGRGERFPGDAGSFWTWREAMYAIVESMDAARLYEICVLAYREMLAAGITTVGEFHYLHHDDSGIGFAMDEVVLQAARDAGIRIVLVNACYQTGGFDAPLAGGQRRFATPSLDAYWRQMDHLAGFLDARTQSFGVVAHSVRAVPTAALRELHEAARRRGMVFHMHLEEQPREIEACLEHHGRGPLRLVLETLELGPEFTAVHLTHSAEPDLAELAERGGAVCICPLTEANLGDGLPDLPAMRRAGLPICLGTDSNARIDLCEEMRWLEYGQRLIRQERGACRDEQGWVAGPLLEMATRNGARALGLSGGSIEPGGAADLVTLDLTRPELAGYEPQTLLESWIFGAGTAAVAEVCVQGAWRR